MTEHWMVLFIPAVPFSPYVSIEAILIRNSQSVHNPHLEVSSPERNEND